MHIEHLELFLQIARYESINQAANALFLAQSTVTNRLKQLEAYIGSALFIRTSTGVQLTSEGKRFVPIATSIVDQLHTYTDRKHIPPLSIVAGKALAAYQLPRLLGEYRRAHPTFTCYARAARYDACVTALLTGAADIAFLGAEVFHPQLHQVLLPEDPIVLVLSPDHPWAKGFPGFDYWGREEVITFGNHTAPFRRQIDLFLAKHQVYPNIIMELDSFSAVKSMVQENLGMTLLPSRTIQTEVQKGDLVACDIAAGTLSRPTVLAYPTYKKESEALQPFIQWVKTFY
ncbi:LysR substrate-binding domain-containing protein [Thalassobacillus pellis]|uniref:LysR substrate-binding domain-containing protein n=1 Tax=Thalassobacillus pellis TaxID=748008 RepID=UPI00196031D5|nr:DNA-binding transcriptional LysR family regulator [Thalassobacillus pellis]